MLRGHNDGRRIRSPDTTVCTVELIGCGRCLVSRISSADVKIENEVLFLGRRKPRVFGNFCAHVVALSSGTADEVIAETHRRPGVEGGG